MAVPKKKTSKARSRMRRAAAWRLSAPSSARCSRCGSVRRPHHVCTNCGWYRGREALSVE